jgi:hypothetical protein
MWPQAERSCCLFAEGGKTTHGLLIQPHLGAPGSAVFALAAQLRLRKVVGLDLPRGLLEAPRPRQDKAGWPQQKRAWCPDFNDSCHRSLRGK